MEHGKLAKKILTLLGISLDSTIILDKLDDLLHEEYQTLKEVINKLEVDNLFTSNLLEFADSQKIKLNQQMDELRERIELMKDESEISNKAIIELQKQKDVLVKMVGHNLKPCNEYQALKEENEKLKEEGYIDNLEIEFDKLKQQRDELVEMLGKVINNLTYPTEFLRNIRDEAEELIQKIK